MSAGLVYQGRYPTPFERHVAKMDRTHANWLAKRGKEFMKIGEEFWLAGVQYGWELAHREAKKKARKVNQIHTECTNRLLGRKSHVAKRKSKA